MGEEKKNEITNHIYSIFSSFFLCVNAAIELTSPDDDDDDGSACLT